MHLLAVSANTAGFPAYPMIWASLYMLIIANVAYKRLRFFAMPR